MGPFPTAPAQKKLLLVATDYFSKWIEAEAFVSIKDRDVTRFIWKNIVYWFGIPRTIVSDNGPQFDSDELKSHPFSVHFSDLFLSKKTDLCAEIWNN